MTTQTAHARTARQRPPRRIMDARWSVLLGIVFVWCLAPFFWLVMTSFKRGDRALNDPDLFQGPFGLDNYIAVLGQGFLLNMRNSLVVATMTTVVCTIIGALAAYAIARLPLKRRVLWLSGVLAASLFPPVSLVPPLYEVWRSIGLLNTWEGLYVSYVSFSLPLTIFILTTFFAAIPSELEEAAKIDGATPLQAFRKVILPLAGPGLFSAAIITFVSASRGWLRDLMTRMFDHVSRELIADMKQIMPQASEEDLYWAYHFMTAAYTFSIGKTERIDVLSGGLVSSGDFAELARRLPIVVAAGIRAMVDQAGTLQSRPFNPMPPGALADKLVYDQD